MPPLQSTIVEDRACPKVGDELWDVEDGAPLLRLITSDAATTVYEGERTQTT